MEKKKKREGGEGREEKAQDSEIGGKKFPSSTRSVNFSRKIFVPSQSGNERNVSMNVPTGGMISLFLDQKKKKEKKRILFTLKINFKP